MSDRERERRVSDREVREKGEKETKRYISA